MINPGRTNPTAQDLPRRFLGPAIRGPTTDALLAALATGDQAVADQRAFVRQQAHLATATGTYLETRVRDEGISVPANLGMADADLRDLAIDLLTNRMTEVALLDIVRVFYGQDSLQAFVEAPPEPYALADDMDLELTVDERQSLVITFHTTQFKTIGAAGAAEVAAVLNLAFAQQGTQAAALSHQDPQTGANRLRIYSGTPGLASALRVTGGWAQTVFQFPTVVLQGQVGQTWAVSSPSFGVTRLTLTGPSSTNVGLVRPGDYVLVFGAGFSAANRGTWVVKAVSITYPGGTLTQAVDVVLTGTPQSVVLATTLDLVFGRPQKVIPQDQPNAALVSSAQGLTRVVLPATSPAVHRHLLDAAYLHAQPVLTATATRYPNGNILVDTGTPHGLQAPVDGIPQSQVFLDDFMTTVAPPGVTTGGAGLTDYSFGSLWSGLTDMGEAIGNHQATVTSSGDVLVSGGGTVTAGVGTDSAACQRYRTTGSTDQAQGIQYAYTWVATASLGTARQLHTATGLPSGAVLVAGGSQVAGTILASCEVYNPAADTWSATTALGQARSGHVALALQDGRIMVTGGASAPTVAQASAEAYSEPLRTWTLLAFMATPRVNHAAVVLPSGLVLVAGGRTLDTGTFQTGLGGTPEVLGPVTAACEVYNPQTNVWAPTGALTYARAYHALVVLDDGRVVALGGFGYNPTQSTVALALPWAEVWDPQTGQWATLASAAVARGRPKVARLSTDKVFIFGGPPGAPSEYLDLQKLTFGLAPQLVAPNGLDPLVDYGPAAVATLPLLTPSSISFDEAVSIVTSTVLVTGGVTVSGGVGFNSVLVFTDVFHHTPQYVYLSGGNVVVDRVAPLAPQFPVGVAIDFTDVTLATPEYVFVNNGALIDNNVAPLGFLTGPLSVMALYDLGGGPSAYLYSSGGVPTVGPTDPTASSSFNTVASARLYVPNADAWSGGRLNQALPVMAVNSATEFLVQTPEAPQFGRAMTGTIQAQSAAPAGTQVGPYAWDTEGGVAITGTQSTTTQALQAGQSYTKLGLTSASAFPDAPGYLVFAYGTAQQVGPVAYLGRLDATTLALDAAQVWPNDLSLGTPVILLAQRGPFVPPHPDQVGSAYLTDSPSGRLGAQELVLASVATGLPTVIDIVYPGDRGLGAEGAGTTGPRVSDVVGVWAGSGLVAPRVAGA